MLTVITPTGGRQEAIELLNGYLERQTDQDFYWIILDDVEPAGHAPSRCDEYIVSDWVWDGETTQAKSMLRLLKDVEGDVVVCEDDDWYAPNHIEVMRDMLRSADIVGQSKTVYYNIKNKTYREFRKGDHACMCQTAFKGDAIEHLRKVCADAIDTGRIDLDIRFWRSYEGKKSLSNNMTVVGIKGMKGRAGLGMGHTMKGTHDRNYEYLESLIGGDVKNYKKTGKRFIICASGGSLTADDVDYVKGKGTVIVINNTYELAPWADILYACDRTWWRANSEAIEHKGRKISIQYDHPEVEKWESNNKLNGLGEDVIHTGGNSGYQAINLAYLMGATEIILLGYDMQITEGLSHWHGDHKKGLSQQHCFKGWIGHMNILAQHLKQRGVNVYNCSRQTALECFERKNLEDVC